MSRTLRIRVVGPQQSWGTRSRFDLRDTEVAPTKSGIVGLVAAAMGLPRGAGVGHLAALRMGVRIDRPGVRMEDYHTTLDVVDSEGKPSKDAVVSQRAYLSDAAFLVGLEGDAALLEEIQASLLDPHWPLALGRRSFAPSMPVAFSADTDPEPLVDEALEPGLVACAPVVQRATEGSVRYLIEDPRGEQEWFDQPVDDFTKRTFAPRRVKVLEVGWGQTWF